jgi:hypothetical protein
MKNGLILSPYILEGMFEVDVSRIRSKKPLYYAFGELLARSKKEITFYEDVGEYEEIYRGYKEYDEKNPKTIILREEKIQGVVKTVGQKFALVQRFNFWCEVMGKHYFFINGLIEL